MLSRHRCAAAMLATCNALAEVIGWPSTTRAPACSRSTSASPPEIVHHTLEPAGARHLDRHRRPLPADPPRQPVAQRRPSLCRFRDESPDRFRSSGNTVSIVSARTCSTKWTFCSMADRSVLVLVVGRRKCSPRPSRPAATDREHRPGCRAISGNAGLPGRLRASDGGLHRRPRCFDNLGEGVLTDREQEITRLLLRGHSAKSVYRELRIAPGTVMVHKRNLFAKLGITSQNELFSRFIDELSRPDIRQTGRTATRSCDNVGRVPEPVNIVFTRFRPRRGQRCCARPSRHSPLTRSRRAADIDRNSSARPVVTTGLPARITVREEHRCRSRHLAHVVAMEEISRASASVGLSRRTPTVRQRLQRWGDDASALACPRSCPANTSARWP